MERRGVYDAKRAAALSGVPLSTVHDWARKRRVVPSVSPVRIKLWSYTDVMGLRAMYWLRHPKPTAEGEEIPPTPMSAVQDALNHLASIDLGLWEEGRGYMVRVNRAGEVWVGPKEDSQPLSGQLPIDELDLVEPFESERGVRGPDLIRPRPHLRIIPGKLAGSPHLVDTRLETEAVAAIAKRGVGKPAIYQLYPQFDRTGIDEAIELEKQLARNLEPVAAAA